MLYDLNEALCISNVTTLHDVFIRFIYVWTLEPL